MPESSDGGWNMHGGCSFTIACQLEFSDSGSHIMEEAETGHCCMQCFRVPVPELQPSVTRSGHVHVPSGVTCPAYRVIDPHLPGIGHASLVHVLRKSSFIRILKSCR